jgi:CBS domain-containing protein/biotin operon repressor
MGGINIELTSRQLEIVELVTKHEPVTGEHIAELLGVSRTTLRSDFSLLVMLGMLDAKPKVGYFLGSSMSPAVEKLKKFQVMKVRDVQGIPIIVRESSAVQDAVITMFLEDVGSLIVVNETGDLTGIVSRKDLLKVTVGNPGASSMPISLVMTRQPNLITVDPEESVVHAAEKLIKHQVDSLPVISKENGDVQITGRITKTTVTRILLDFFGN